MTVGLTGARRVAFAALATVLTLSLSGQAYASGGSQVNRDRPDRKITLDVVTVNGSGCPAGTERVDVADDNTSFRVTYRDYVAQIGGNAGPTDFRKNCQIHLLVHVPQGFTFAIARAEYNGFADLRHDTYALQRANYYLQGSPANNWREHRFDGAFRGRWTSTDVTPVAELVFARCGEDHGLNINTELRVHGPRNRHAPSYISMRSTEGSIHTLYHFHWKRC